MQTQHTISLQTKVKTIPVDFKETGYKIKCTHAQMFLYFLQQLEQRKTFTFVPQTPLNTIFNQYTFNSLGEITIFKTGLYK